MEKPDPADDERESTPDSDFASIVKTKPDKRKRAADGKADESDHKKSYRRSWRSASPLTKLMIYFTALIAVSTLVYSGFSAGQWYEIHSGAEETRKLAQAASDTANAAQRQANVAVDQLQALRDATKAAKDSASAANTAIEQNKDLVRAAQIQANTSQVSARAAESSARTAEQGTEITKEAMRPVGAIESSLGRDTPDEMIVSLKLKNEGGTVTQITFKYCLMKDTEPNVHGFSECQVGKTATKGPFIVPAHNFESVHIRVAPDVARGARAREFYFYVVGEFSYEDFGVVKVAPYCSVYRDDFKTMGSCSDLNEPANRYPIKKNPN